MHPSVQSLDRLAFVDLETTGLDASKEEIVEVGVCFVEGGSIIARRSWLIRPSRTLPGIITALTGLRDEDLRPAPPFELKRDEIAAALAGWTLVAHNAEFERSFLGALIEAAPVLDSCELMHLLFPELPSHALDFLVRWTGIGDGARHRALEDAEDTFAMLAAAFERVASSGRRADVERLVARLSPPEGRDAQALVQLLARLSVHCAQQSPALPPPRPLAHVVDEALVGRFMASLGERLPHGQRLIAMDVERPALEAVLEAGRRFGRASGTCVTVALPQRLLRELAGEVLIPRQQVCSTRLEELVNTGGVTDEARLSRAWLESWAGRSAHGDLATPSGWMAERHPETRALLQLARGCTCTDPACFVRRTERRSDSAAMVVVSHELALDWLERGAPVLLLVGHAELLPEAERRRTSVTLDGRRLTSVARLVALLSPGHPLVGALREGARWLAHALEGPPVLLDAHQRTQRAWLDTRDLLLGLGKDLGRALAGPLAPWTPVARELAEQLARVLQVPPPGFEVRAGDGRVQLASTAPAAQVLARVRGQTVLVSAVRGGASWSGEPASWVPPAVMPWSIEFIAEPLPLDGLVKVLGRLGADAVVTVFLQGPPDAAAMALRSSGLPFRLLASARSLRGRGVLLGRWAPDTPAPPSTQVVLYGLREWRTAVVTSGARHLTLAAPGGIPDPVAAELADVAALAGVRRVVGR